MVWVPVMVFTISMAIFLSFNKLHSHPDILEKLPKFMSDWIAQRKTNITSLSNSLQILCQHFKFYTFQFCFEIFYFNQRFIKQKGICSRPSASEYLRWKDRKWDNGSILEPLLFIWEFALDFTIWILFGHSSRLSPSRRIPLLIITSSHCVASSSCCWCVALLLTAVNRDLTGRC